MEKRVLIIGSTGMLGHQVLKRFEKISGYEVFDIVYRKKRRKNSIICDVTNFNKLSEIISDIKPNFIINCVGILISDSNNSIIKAIKINSLLPHFLKKACDQSDSKLIHISTDCVFSGNDGLYSEDDFRDADDIYGRTKALGEIFSTNHLTIRTSIVGPDLKKNGVGLLNWFFTNKNTEISGFSNVFWGGVSTIELARVIVYSIENNISGLWNLTNGLSISKYQILNHFNNFFLQSHKKKIHESDSYKSNKSLKSERTDIDYKVPDYDYMFEEIRIEIINNKVDYSHYENLR